MFSAVRRIRAEKRSDVGAEFAVTTFAADSTEALGVTWRATLWIALMAAALGLRLPNLGTLGLWGDEGYTGLAVKAILEYGYPALPTGGLYLRSLPYLYVDAFAVKVFGLNEFALRLPSVVANLGAIWMSYLLGRLLFGKTVGLLTAVMMVFAGWEIEFARHGRFYAAFQFLYICSVYVFYRGFIEGHKASQWLTLPIWLLTMMVHELGVVLAVLFLVPLFVNGCSLTKVCKALAGFFLFGLLGIATGQVVWASRFGEPVTGLEAAPVTTGIISQALLPFGHLVKLLEANHGAVAIAIVLGSITILAIAVKGFRSSEARWRYLALIPLVMACAIGQLGLAAMWLVLYSGMFLKTVEDRGHAPFVVGVGILAVSSITWGLTVWASGLSFRASMRFFFDYPHVYERFGKFFLTDWPIEVGLAAVGAITLWNRYARKCDGRAFFALAAVLAPILIVSLIPRSDDGARYSFHLFPMILMWGSCAIVYIATEVIPGRPRSLKIAGLVLILLLLPSDMELFHGIRIGQREYGDAFTRPHIASSRAFPFFPDYKTPAEQIRKHLRGNDLVVSMRATIPFYYVGRLDYIWTSDRDTQTNDLRLSNIDSDGLRHLATTNPGRRIWFLTDAFRLSKRRAESNSFLRAIARCTVYKGADRHTAVYLFSFDSQGQLVCLNPAD
jgi:4-amino-4-deoxy-L-arabinose transferase-like glycosyltransferase